MKRNTPGSANQMAGSHRADKRSPPNITPAPAKSSTVGVIAESGFGRAVRRRSAFAFCWRFWAMEIGALPVGALPAGRSSSSYARISSISRSNLSGITHTLGDSARIVDSPSRSLYAPPTSSDYEYCGLGAAAG